MSSPFRGPGFVDPQQHTIIDGRGYFEQQQAALMQPKAPQPDSAAIQRGVEIGVNVAALALHAFAIYAGARYWRKKRRVVGGLLLLWGVPGVVVNTVNIFKAGAR